MKHFLRSFIPKCHNDVLRMIPGLPLAIAYSREAKKWKSLLQAQIGRPDEPVDFKVHLTLRITRPRRQDPDNAVASTKPVRDALVKLGWLRDDGDKYLRCDVYETGTRDSSRWGTEIEWRRDD